MGDDVRMDGCMLSNFFQIATPPTIFVQFLHKLEHMMCQYKKTVEQIFGIWL